MSEGLLILIVLTGCAAGVGLAIGIGSIISDYVSHRKLADVFMSFEEFHSYYRQNNTQWDFIYDQPRFSPESSNRNFDIGFNFVDWLKYKIWHFIRTKQIEKEEKIAKREKLRKQFYDIIEKEEDKDDSELCIRIYAALEEMEEKHEKPKMIELSLRAYRELRKSLDIVIADNAIATMYGIPVGINALLPDSVDFEISKQDESSRKSTLLDVLRTYNF